MEKGAAFAYQDRAFKLPVFSQKSRLVMRLVGLTTRHVYVRAASKFSNFMWFITATARLRTLRQVLT